MTSEFGQINSLFFSPASQNVRVFADVASFVRHLRKHVLADSGEGGMWRRVLDCEAPAWRSINVRRLPEAAPGQNPVYSDACPPDTLRAVYEDICRYCASGVTYSTGKPVYGVAVERWAGLREEEGCIRETWYLVSRDGALIILWGGVLRTVFFPVSCRGDSPHDVYAQAIRSVMTRVVRSLSQRPHYSANEGSVVTGISGELVRRENFFKAENPWPRPGGRKGFTASQKRLENRAFIQGYEYDED